MLLTVSSAILCATLFLAISSVNARPHEVRTPVPMRLPLRRLHDPRSSTLHPRILMQQHVNRGHRRMAQLTGGPIPTDDELAESLIKRLVDLGHSAAHYHPEKRKVMTGHEDTAAMSRNQAAQDLKRRTERDGSDASTVAIQNSHLQLQPSLVVDRSAHARADSSSLDSLTLDWDAAKADSLTPANPPSGDYSLGLDIQANDVGYIATISIGTPSQDFNVLMDTGSADFWVYGTDCRAVDWQGGANCFPQHTTLGPDTSSTFNDLKESFNVTYGTGTLGTASVILGSVSGNLVQDTVAIAGMALTNHTFGAASVETASWVFDGIMGLAQHTLSQQRLFTPVEALYNAGFLTDPVLSFKISRLADQLNDGELIFGSSGPMTYDNTTFISTDTITDDNHHRGAWELAMDNITVNGAPMAPASLGSPVAILDTSTALILGPRDGVSAVHALISGAKSYDLETWTIPCATNASVAFGFQDQLFDVDPRDMRFLPVNQTDLEGDCISGIASVNSSLPVWILGDVFLKNVYVSLNEGSLNGGNDTVSLAKWL